jgi:hypothetical protein
MRTPRIVAGMVLALAAAGFAFALAGDCDLRTTEPVSYCEKCEKALDKDKIKSGKCDTCQTPVRKAEYCVKKTKDGQPDKCLVIYVCEGCGARSPIKAILKHDEAKDKDAKKKGVKRTCEKSGSAPHSTGK